MQTLRAFRLSTMRCLRRGGDVPLSFFFVVVVPVFVFFSALVAGFFLTGYQDNSGDRRKQLFLSTQASVSSPEGATGSSSTVETRQTVLYVGSRDNSNRLVPYPFTIDVGQSTKELVDRVVQALQGPFDDSKILATVPKGTRLLSVFLTRKRLVVNLSREFGQLHIGGTQGSRLTLYSLVNSLIDLGLGDEVQILIQGREETGFLDHLDLSQPLGFQSRVLAGRGSAEEVVEPGASPTAVPSPSSESATAKSEPKESSSAAPRKSESSRPNTNERVRAKTLKPSGKKPPRTKPPAAKKTAVPRHLPSTPPDGPVVTPGVRAPQDGDEP